MLEIDSIQKEIDKIKSLTDKIKASSDIQKYGYAIIHLGLKIQDVKKRLAEHDAKEAKANETKDKLTATFGENYDE